MTDEEPLPKRRLTRRCSGGRVAQFLRLLAKPFTAPLNAGVRPLEPTGCNSNSSEVIKDMTKWI
jgi:hypothetical protein